MSLLRPGVIKQHKNSNSNSILPVEAEQIYFAILFYFQALRNNLIPATPPRETPYWKGWGNQ